MPSLNGHFHHLQNTNGKDETFNISDPKVNSYIKHLNNASFRTNIIPR